MRIVVVGTGYVGLVTGTCFAEMGNRVICVDTDKEKIQSLRQGCIPIYEPGLAEMVKRNCDSGDLKFSTSLAEAIENAEVVFIAVGTPMGEDGSADLSYVLAVAREIGECMSGPLVIVDKSTVPVGTADRVRETIQIALQARAKHDASVGAFHFDVVSNPEFLKEGSAVADFMRPDRVVIGADSADSLAVLESLYEPFILRGNSLIAMDVRSAELTKYAANAMLACRISFMNEIAQLCECVGANVSKVRAGMGADSRIGTAFLYPGCGYGGSCFPKDTAALIRVMKEQNSCSCLIEAIEKVNDDQKTLIHRKIVRRFGDSLNGLTFAVWGLSFKPNTDDMREAPSLVTVRELVRRGAKIQTFDPKAMPQAQSFYFHDLASSVAYCKSKYDALDGASALILLTEWSVFRSPDLDELRSRLLLPIIFDGRNQFERFDLCNAGFEYYAMGIPGSQFPREK
ncbi:MAG: UDP-glucose/GDP-mannose dehydrogenase family protein [Planctomycetia bacterium]|nr:UDP-glucose/GDP-mannose dehydrogenase family protein [Planctomycetia bacterium]